VPPNLIRLVLHPKVYSDIDEIMGYYERIGTAELADEILCGASALHEPGCG